MWQLEAVLRRLDYTHEIHMYKDVICGTDIRICNLLIYNAIYLHTLMDVSQHTHFGFDQQAQKTINHHIIQGFTISG